jgi:NADPH:quinone reductase-like Zn-dependent oxidoreductase
MWAGIVDAVGKNVTRFQPGYEISGGETDGQRLLEPGGVYVMVTGPKGRWLRPVPRLISVILVSWFLRQKMVGGRRLRSSPEDVQFLKALLEAERVKPVIDRTYPLIETSEAIGYLAEGHARGEIVITV